MKSHIPALVRERRLEGFTMIEIMIVCSIISLLAAIAIPSFVKYRAEAQTKTCLANLKQLEGAKEQWALDYKKVTGDTIGITDLVGLDKYIKNTPQCPAGFDYQLNNLGQTVICPSGIVGHALP